MCVWFQIVLFSLLTFDLLVKGERRFDRECSYVNSSTRNQHGNCICSRSSSMCLICNVSKRIGNLNWYNDISNLTLARQSFKIQNTESFEVDLCHSSNYSILLFTPCMKENQAKYSCRQGETMLMTFILTLQDAVPVTSGRFLSLSTDTLHTTRKSEGRQPREFTNTWVIVAGAFVLISSCLLVCVCITVKKCRFSVTRNRQGNINSSHQMKVLDKDALDTDQSINRNQGLTEGRKELPNIHVDEENSQNSHNSGGSERNYYSTTDVISGKDPRILNENDISIIMKIKIGKIYKRWMGSLHLSNETDKCVVVTTLTEQLFRKKEIHWEAYIRKCLELPASNHLAKIEAISIHSDKLFLISEHLVCENLHKVLSRDTKYEKDYYCCSSLSVPDVIKHIAGVLEGMDILNTFGFLHPGLTTKKVLLTKEGQVKLFDFCLARDAPKIAALKKEKIRSVTLNQFPPEMLMLNQYTESSDVWSTAVVTWEIMKAGIPPFPVDREVRFDEDIIKPSVPWPEKFLQIRDKILFDCWNYICSLRPSIHQLRATFVAIFEKLITDSSYEIPIPTTYLPMRTPDTAQPTYAEQIYHAGM
ncbi:uncharacterized protein [Apostichopus japonicus]|uniref:uncharacterized protein isoform X2 n=1 Tax=Stichopus japonicus TaxID=307972 RepID=UPI003AB7FB9B